MGIPRSGGTFPENSFANEIHIHVTGKQPQKNPVGHPRCRGLKEVGHPPNMKQNIIPNKTPELQFRRPKASSFWS